MYWSGGDCRQNLNSNLKNRIRRFPLRPSRDKPFLIYFRNEKKLEAKYEKLVQLSEQREKNAPYGKIDPQVIVITWHAYKQFEY